jgi:cytochrome c553
MSRAKFIGKPTHQAIPTLCGKCHSDAEYMKKFNPTLRVDQVQEYFTSVHGKLLKKGDKKVATCISCHDVHRIRAIKDQQAWTYPVKIVDTCGRCHGDPTTAGYKIAAMSLLNKERSTTGATRKEISRPHLQYLSLQPRSRSPGVESVAHVCGTCDSVPAESSPDPKPSPAWGCSPAWSATTIMMS